MGTKAGGSSGIAIGVTAIVVFALVSIGYYQYVYVGTSTTTSTSTETRPAAMINITLGAASKTDDAYAPNPVTLVIGLNNTFVVYNGDIQGGVGVPHTLTDRGGSFNTGVIQGGETSAPITISAPGTYDTFCVIHPTTMRVTIRVVQGSGATSSTTTTKTSTKTSTSTSVSSSTGTGSGAGVSIVNGAATDTKAPGFGPASFTVVVGLNNTVTWTNMDVAPHTVTAMDNSFDSGNLNAGDQFTHTFSAPGTYQIKCNYHPWMHQTIIVKAGG